MTARTVSPACSAASGRLAPEARAVRILRSRAVGLRCCWLVVSMWAVCSACWPSYSSAGRLSVIASRVGVRLAVRRWPHCVRRWPFMINDDLCENVQPRCLSVRGSWSHQASAFEEFLPAWELHLMSETLSLGRNAYVCTAAATAGGLASVERRGDFGCAST